MFYVAPPTGPLALLALISRESTFYLYEVKVESWKSSENDETSILAIEEIITFCFFVSRFFLFFFVLPFFYWFSVGFQVERKPLGSPGKLMSGFSGQIVATRVAFPPWGAIGAPGVVGGGKC